MSPWRKEVGAQVRLAVPVVVLQVGLMAMGVVDTAMMGRVSDLHLAAVALGNTWVFALVSFGLGMLQALDPIVSQAFGAADRAGIARALQRGLVLALVVSVPIGAVVALAEPGLLLLRQDEALVEIASVYALVSIASVPPFLVFVALRQGLQAMHLMRPLLLTVVLANLFNVVADWALIFGNLGLPALGAVGCAWATVVARWVQALGILVIAWPLLAPYLRPLRREALAPKPLLRTVRLGAPIGAQFVLEIGAFGLAAILMGWLGSGAEQAPLAGHQVALNLAALTFMVPLGMGMAASVRVGNEIGAARPDGARRAAAVSLLGGPAFMACTAAVFLAAPAGLARLYTDEPDVLAVAATLIPLAGVFQVFDGTQVVAGGCLRGAGDVRFPMLVHLLGFWALGLPLGWYLAFHRELGPRGLWWGLVAGLAFVAVVLLVRVRVRLARALERLRIDDDEPALAPDRAPGG